MQDLLIINKYPNEGTSKTRLGRDVGYEKSANLARLLLEDLIHNASQVCGVTVVSPLGDLDKFRSKYPELEVYGAPVGLIPSLSCSIQHQYDRKNSKKVIVITGDIIASEEEIDGWFNDLKSHNLIIGPTRDFRFYQAGLDEEFGERFAQYLSENPSFENFLYAGFKTVLGIPKIKISGIKRDIDTLDDLKRIQIGSIALPERTRDYIRTLVDGYGAAPILHF
jgi:glycosyltransferase A (GT-A) superfamily protein (DUF2064 family)